MGLEIVNQSPRGGDHENRLMEMTVWYIFTLNTVTPNGMNEDLPV